VGSPESDRMVVPLPKPKGLRVFYTPVPIARGLLFYNGTFAPDRRKVIKPVCQKSLYMLGVRRIPSHFFAFKACYRLSGLQWCEETSAWIDG
jgi:hypothetical protein